MNYSVTELERPESRVYAVKAEHFPDGMPDAWARLESKFPPAKGTRFYGLLQTMGGTPEYFASVDSTTVSGTVPDGFLELTIPGGTYARVRLRNWRERTSEFSTVFECLEARYDFREGGYSVEWYKSQNEVQLMIPIRLL